MNQETKEMEARCRQLADAFYSEVMRQAAAYEGTGGMSNVTHSMIQARFFEECGREEPRFLRTRRNLFVDQQNRLCYSRDMNATEYGIDTNEIAILAEFVGKRHNGGILLLNGDGFVDFTAQDWQTRIRDNARMVFGPTKTPVIPYEALTAARIDTQTIKPIEITQDVQERVEHTVPVPFDLRHTITSQELRSRLQALRARNRNNSRAEVNEASRTTAFLLNFEGMEYNISLHHTPHTETWSIYQVQVLAPTLDGAGAPQWFIIRPQRGSTTQGTYVENVHRLGACVFRAVGWDDRPHRWISGFDQLEPQPLYYLAQLPQKGECKTYKQAVDLLAPPIVHHARASGKRVERQGDIFAIETDLNTRHIYSRAVTRVRRDVVLQRVRLVERLDTGSYRTEFRFDHETGEGFDGKTADQRVRNLRTDYQAPREGEVTDEIDSPFPFAGSKVQVGNGPSAIEALKIFGTSHTADEVVVCEGGVTFVRGTLFHDPFLEEAGREPEHVIRPLDGKKWFLAVRNTVPRQAADPVQEETAPAEEQDSAEAAPTVAA